MRNRHNRKITKIDSINILEKEKPYLVSCFELSLPMKVGHCSTSFQVLIEDKDDMVEFFNKYNEEVQKPNIDPFMFYNTIPTFSSSTVVIEELHKLVKRIDETIKDSIESYREREKLNGTNYIDFLAPDKKSIIEVRNKEIPVFNTLDIYAYFDKYGRENTFLLNTDFSFSTEILLYSKDNECILVEDLDYKSMPILSLLSQRVDRLGEAYYSEDENFYYAYIDGYQLERYGFNKNIPKCDQIVSKEEKEIREQNEIEESYFKFKIDKKTFAVNVVDGFDFLDGLFVKNICRKNF